MIDGDRLNYTSTISFHKKRSCIPSLISLAVFLIPQEQSAQSVVRSLLKILITGQSPTQKIFGTKSWKRGEFHTIRKKMSRRPKRNCILWLSSAAKRNSAELAKGKLPLSRELGRERPIILGKSHVENNAKFSSIVINMKSDPIKNLEPARLSLQIIGGFLLQADQFFYSEKDEKRENCTKMLPLHVTIFGSSSETASK